MTEQVSSKFTDSVLTGKQGRLHTLAKNIAKVEASDKDRNQNKHQDLVQTRRKRGVVVEPLSVKEDAEIETPPQDTPPTGIGSDYDGASVIIRTKKKKLNRESMNTFNKFQNSLEEKSTEIENKTANTSWRQEGEWKKANPRKNILGKLHNLVGRALKKSKELTKEDLDEASSSLQQLRDKLNHHAEKAIEANKQGDDEAVKKHQVHMNKIKTKMGELAKREEIETIAFDTFRKALAEKILTPAEKKKREEIAQAIERENPDMPMDKKMAIATAQAKKVAEEVETVIEATEESLRKKIQSKRDALGLARERRRARGNRQQGHREIKLQAEIDNLGIKLTQFFNNKKANEGVEIDEAGPFSYGYKSPRKSTVRWEREQGLNKAKAKFVDYEVKDDMVGTARRVNGELILSKEEFEIDEANEPTKHSSEDSVARDLKTRYGNALYKSKATGGTHVISQWPDHYRAGAMRSKSLSGLLHLIDRKVKNESNAIEETELEESVSKFASTVDKAEAAYNKGNTKLGNYHLANARSHMLAMKSTEIPKISANGSYSKYKNLRDKHYDVKIVETLEQTIEEEFTHKHVDGYTRVYSNKVPTKTSEVAAHISAAKEYLHKVTGHRHSFNTFGNVSRGERGYMEFYRTPSQESSEGSAVDQIDEVSGRLLSRYLDKTGALSGNWKNLSRKRKKSSALAWRKKWGNPEGTEPKVRATESTQVYSALLGEGVVLESQHAEPDESGQIQWFMVEFKSGIHKIYADDLGIMIDEWNNNH